jgi:hypothetical protein
MVLNFQHKKERLLIPVRCCLKSTGPEEVSLIHKPNTGSIHDRKKTTTNNEKTISNVRLAVMFSSRSSGKLSPGLAGMCKASEGACNTDMVPA